MIEWDCLCYCLFLMVNKIWLIMHVLKEILIVYACLCFSSFIRVIRTIMILIDFLGWQFGPVEIEDYKYNLACLCNEAIIKVYAQRIRTYEMFEIEARLPWVNNYKTIIYSYRHLMEMLTKFRERELDVIHFECTLLPLEVMHLDELLSTCSAPRPTQPDT